MEDAATNTDPPKVTTIGDTSHELKIFKTKKPIKECKDERALTSKKSTKESPTKNFFRKMGFGTKSASVSPTKELGKVKTRRASEQRLNSTKITKPLPKIDAEKSKKDAEPKIETKKVEEATEIVAEKKCDSPHDNIQPINEKGTESDARVTQTIIMKKKNLHEESAEAVIMEMIEGHPETAHSTVSLDVTEPEKSVTKTRNPEFLKPDHPQIQKQISSSSTLNSISTLSKPGNSKTSSTCTISSTISAPNSTRTAPNRSSELDLSGPLSRLQMTGIPEKKQEISLTEKLSKSFFDLTQGSQDRLQKWKNKLQNGKKMKFGKDMSEPPDLVRKFPDLSDMDTLLDWTTTDKPKFVATGPQSKKLVVPRPLHTSKSATNALANGILDPDVYQSDPSQGIVKRSSLRESQMEHRTLKTRENGGGSISKRNPLQNSTHYQNMKNLQQLMQTIDGYSGKDLNLPPPAKILPYSGIKPQDNGIIRPIAFRPMNQENSRSIGNLVMAASTSTSVGPTPRQRTSGHPSTSSSSNSTLFPLTNSMSTSKIQAIDDNDYDTVPEFIDNRKNESSDPASDNYSLIYNLQQTATQPTRRTQSGASSAGSSNNGNNHFNGFHVVNATSLTSSNSSSTTTSGLPNSPPHSSGSNSSVKKSGSRHSGLHITPSPSDSGIVDYEFQSLIRDKENELTTVRNAMEQNEEVLIRVYQEKERQYREQMCELRQKLQTSQQGENTLRIQLRQSEDNRNELQRNFDILSEEKNGLQKRCQQIERELYSIRVKFDDFVRDTKAAPKNCENCKRGIVNGNGNVKAPIPTPRLSKLMEKEDKELRGEVEELKDQVSTLRDQLNNQMRFFAEERKRWEHDRNKSGSPRSNFKNASQDVRTAVLLSNDRLI